MHVREELGVDHRDLPSPYTAAAASLVTFSIGALIPLLPYLFKLNSLAVALALAAVAAFVGGGLVARLTDRPFLRGALRQLVLGAAAAGITFLIGLAVGAGVSAGNAAAARPSWGYQASAPNASSSCPLGPRTAASGRTAPSSSISSVNPVFGFQPSRCGGLGRVGAQLVHLGRRGRTRRPR